MTTETTPYPFIEGHKAGYRDAIMDAADTARNIGTQISKGALRRAGPDEQGEQTAVAIERLRP